jgi:hypothetical protein
MADRKLSALTAETLLASTDELLLVSGGASKKISGLNLGKSLEGGAWTTIVKASDTSRNTTTTLAIDPELQFTPVAGAIYEFELLLISASPLGGGTPDIKWSVTRSYDSVFHGLEGVLHVTTLDALQTAANQLGTHNPLASGTAADKRMSHAWGYYVASDTSAVGLWWSQATSDANDVTVYTGSTLRYRRII